jgi:hypothetical protein
VAADPIHESHALDCPVCGVRLTEFRYRRHGHFVCSEACRDVVVVIDEQTVAEDFRPWPKRLTIVYRDIDLPALPLPSSYDARFIQAFRTGMVGSACGYVCERPRRFGRTREAEYIGCGVCVPCKGLIAFMRSFAGHSSGGLTSDGRKSEKLLGRLQAFARHHNVATTQRYNGDHRGVKIVYLQPEPCTGVSATWCPNCGDCTCPREEDGSPVEVSHYPPAIVTDACIIISTSPVAIEIVEDPACPLHGASSRHADSGALTSDGRKDD